MIRNLHERAFIERLRARNPKFSNPSVRLALGDDAAILRPRSGFESLLTCDLLVESVHFELSQSPSPREAANLGIKALAASLSDIAAMGGLARAYLISLAIPKRKALDEKFFKHFYTGMEGLGRAFGAELAGGDTSVSPSSLFIDILVWGEVERGRALSRSGAKPGDLVYCSGFLGEAAAGLKWQGLRKRERSKAALAARAPSSRHEAPIPRVLEGRLLLQKALASSCIDVSDGLASELHHLAEESGVAIELEAAAVPLSAKTQAFAAHLHEEALDWALRGGEDYELLFSVPASKVARLEASFRAQSKVPLSCIGRVKAGRGVRIHGAKGWKKLENVGYEHKIF